MPLSVRIFAIIAGLAIFVGLPLLLYTRGDAPGRCPLKEAISLGQFGVVRQMRTSLR